jgi:diguanylate cyclase (GGDEF)-like protein
MAANDHHQHTDRVSSREHPPAPAALDARLLEEIARAERHGTGLSCLLVAFDNLEQMAREHGDELREQTLEYVAGALRGELRCFDRVGRTEDGGVIVLLPGADSPRAEIVARRALDRVRTIKVESAGTRLPLEVSVGLAAWREGMSGQALVAGARAALDTVNGDQTANPASGPPPPATTATSPHAPALSPDAHEQAGPAATLGRMSGE